MMRKIPRRQFFEFVAMGLAWGGFGSGFGQTTANKGILDGLGWKYAGRVVARPSRTIEASPLSVGFEVLDRKCFDPSRAYPYLAELGVKWARCQTGWCRCETTRGSYDFAWLDDVVDSLRSIGIQPWFNLGYGNQLYTPNAPDAYAVGWVPVYDDSAMQAWMRFTEALAKHFSTRVKHWEIWNEPNIVSFWKPEKPNARDYMRLVAQTAPIIRKAVPESVIIGVACSGIKMEYIETCLDAGLTDYVDVVSVHPYRPRPEEGYDQDIAALRAAIAAHRKDVVIWQGENGCPSKGGPESVGALSKLNWDETAQAKWLLRRILTDLRLDIPLTSYYHTVDLLNYLEKTNFKGLLRGQDYTPKPAYYAYQCLCALFDAKTKRAPFSSVSADPRPGELNECGFVRENRALYAYWLAGDLQQPPEPGKISLRLTYPEHATMTEPVLIDPMSGQAYIPDKMEAGETGVDVTDLPLLDYPLILTSRELVKES